jgi:hypothetical protein
MTKKRTDPKKAADGKIRKEYFETAKAVWLCEGEVHERTVK